jgi:hypothetical protein
MSAFSSAVTLAASPWIRTIVPLVKLADGLTVISPAIKTPASLALTV